MMEVVDALGCVAELGGVAKLDGAAEGAGALGACVDGVA